MLTLQCIHCSGCMGWTYEVNKTKYQWLSPRLDRIIISEFINAWNINMHLQKDNLHVVIPCSQVLLLCSQQKGEIYLRTQVKEQD